MSSHLCVLQRGCTAASGAGCADPGPAYLQHLFAENFQVQRRNISSRKVGGNAVLAVGSRAVDVFPAGRSWGRSSGVVLPCSDSASASATGVWCSTAAAWGSAGRRCHCLLDLSLSRYRTVSYRGCAPFPSVEPGASSAASQPRSPSATSPGSLQVMLRSQCWTLLLVSARDVIVCLLVEVEINTIILQLAACAARRSPREE